MTPGGKLPAEEAFRSDLQAHDFSRAEAALLEYVAWLKSGLRTPQEIESAKQLLEWGIEVTSDSRVRIARELMRLKRVFDAYQPATGSQTWRFVG